MNQSLARRRIGRTGCDVTVLGLGGAPLGGLFEVIPEERALATVEAAYASGVSLFDMAPQYGHGLAEHRFGHVLRSKPRDSFTLSTKVGRLLRPQSREEISRGSFKHTLDFGITHDYSYDAVMRSVEDSYQRLGMNQIDIALIHDVDVAHHGEAYDSRFKEAIEGAVPALQELKRAGVIKAIGIGVNEIEPSVRFATSAELDCFMLAGRYTLLQHEGLEEFLTLAETQTFSLLIAGPFNSGILATGPRTGAVFNYRPAAPEVLKRVERIESVCARHDTPLASAAIQFPLGSSRVAAVVTGAVREHEIVDNAKLMSSTVPDALWEELRHEGLLAESVKTPVAGADGGPTAADHGLSSTLC